MGRRSNMGGLGNPNFFRKEGGTLKTIPENLSIRIGGILSSVPSSEAEYQATDTINVTNNTMRVSGFDGGGTILTSTPNINTSNLEDDQQVVIQGFSDPKPLTLQDDINLPGSKLRLKGNLNATLAEGQMLTLRYYKSKDLLFEQSRTES